MTAAYTCPRCVNPIVVGVPHDCALPERGLAEDRERMPDTQNAPRSESASKLGSDSPAAVRPGGEGAPPDPTSPPPYPLSDPNTLAPGGSAQPADVPPDRRTEGAVTPEAGAKTVRWGALPAGEDAE